MMICYLCRRVSLEDIRIILAALALQSIDNVELNRPKYGLVGAVRSDSSHAVVDPMDMVRPHNYMSVLLRMWIVAGVHVWHSKFE